METKGAIIKLIPQYIKEKHGEEKYQEWFGALPQESKKIFENQVLTGQWYPFQYGMKEPINKMVELCYGRDIYQVRELATMISNTTFKGVYKAFIKLGSPNLLMGKADIVAKQLFRPTKLEIIENEKNHAILRYTEFPGMFEALEFAGVCLIETILGLTGAKNAKVKINASIGKGDTYTEYEAIWE
jgi:hypothetical protein